MDKEMFENNIPETQADIKTNDTETADLYSDYPKEIVQILMKNSTLRNGAEDSLKADAEDDSSFSKTRIQNDSQSFIDEKVAAEEPVQLEIEEVKEAAPAKEEPEFIFDDDDDPVQMVRHKDKKKEIKRAFPSNKKPFSLSEEKKPIKKVPERKEKYVPAKGEKTAEEVFMKRNPVFEKQAGNSEFDELKDKFLKEKKAKKKEAIKTRNEVHTVNKDEIEKRKESYKKNADLNEFFELPKKSSSPSKRRAKIDKTIILTCGIVILIIIILFIRTLALSAKLEKAEANATKIEELQKDNEELKLTIVTLEEYLEKNNIGLDGVPLEVEEPEDEPADETEAGEPVDEGYDTYTVVAGDTLGGISEKVYGTFSDYKRILEANGLTESTNLQIGQVLKIPRD